MRLDGGSVEPIGNFESREIHQRRIDVNQADGLGACGTGLDSRAANDEGNVSGLFPDGSLTPVFLLAQMPAVVAHQHDEGFTPARVLLQLPEKPADLAIDERDRCLIRADGGVPLIIGDDVFVIAQAFVERFVGVRSGETPGELRHVGPVIQPVRFGGAANRFERELIEPGFGNLQRAMRTEETD